MAISIPSITALAARVVGSASAWWTATFSDGTTGQVQAGIIPYGATGYPLATNSDGSLTIQPVTAATFRVNAGSAAIGQTLKIFTYKVALSASATTTQTLETVTAGKTFYITDIFLSHDSAAVIDVRIQAAGVDIFRAPPKGDTAPVQMAGIESQPSATAGQLVTVLYPITASPPNAYGVICGFEQ